MTTPVQSSGGGASGNVFSRKIGPLPLWGWMGVAALMAVLFYLAKKNKSNTSNATTGTGGSSTVDSAGGVDSSLVPQFVNQTYVNSSPPSAPPSTSTTTPPGGTSTSPLNEILTSGHTISANADKAVVGWTISQQSPNATQLKVVINGPGAKNQTRYVPASATSATFENLQKGHNYSVAVTPIDAKGQAVGGPNNIDLVTSK